MSIDAKIPETDGEPIVAVCRNCGEEIPRSYAVKDYDSEGNYTGVSVSLNLCTPCGTETERRLVARRVDVARRKAKYEKTLADLINSIPKSKHEQAELNMGLD